MERYCVGASMEIDWADDQTQVRWDFEPARYAMGDTRRFAERVNLIELQPRKDLCSTRYALENLGEEYLVLQPSAAAELFTVLLEPGTYTAEWFSIEGRQTVPAAATTVEGSMATSFSAPSEASGPAVLHLKKVGGQAAAVGFRRSLSYGRIVVCRVDRRSPSSTTPGVGDAG